MGNEKFIGHIEEELERLKEELDQVQKDIVSAEAILVKKKEQQEKLKQELIAVDSMKMAYSQLSQKTTEDDLQQPPEGYSEEQQ